MKIVGGIFRGRKIRSVKEGVRPSTGYVKKRYFDILGNRIVGSLFLDAFSGTGAVGIEAPVAGGVSPLLRAVVETAKKRKQKK